MEGRTGSQPLRSNGISVFMTSAPKESPRAVSKPTDPARNSAPIEFAGGADSQYERHLVMDNIVDPREAGVRERFEAVARSVRDILARRWLDTEKTYARENPKRVYYLSMEFLIGRSLANNVMNLRLDPVLSQAIQNKDFDWVSLL